MLFRLTIILILQVLQFQIVNAQQPVQQSALESCYDEFVAGCGELAAKLMDDPQVNDFYVSSVATIGCNEQNDPVACRAAGMMIARKHDHLNAPGNARDMFARGCDGQDAEACGFLGIYQISGSGGDIDAASARRNLKIGCAGSGNNAEEFCAKLADVSGKTDQELTQASQLERLLSIVDECEYGNIHACELAGQLYAVGEDPNADQERAEHFLGRACDGGVPTSCINLALIHHPLEDDAVKDPESALQYALRACKIGEMNGCRFVDLLVADYPELMPKSYDRQHGAEQYRGMAFPIETPLGRRPSRVFTERPKKAGEILAEASETCSSEEPIACKTAGDIYKEGKEVPQDLAKAAEFYNLACAGDDGESCRTLGIMIFFGDGVEKDTASAQTYFQKACDLGDEEGCKLL